MRTMVAACNLLLALLLFTGCTTKSTEPTSKDEPIASHPASAETRAQVGIVLWEVYADTNVTTLRGLGDDGSEKYVTRATAKEGYTVVEVVKPSYWLAHVTDKGPQVLFPSSDPLLSKLSGLMTADSAAWTDVELNEYGYCTDCLKQAAACGLGAGWCYTCAMTGGLWGCTQCIAGLANCPGAGYDCTCCYQSWTSMPCP